MRNIVVSVDNNTFLKIQMIAQNMGVKPSDLMQEILNTPVFKDTLNMMWQALVKTSEITNDVERQQAFIKEIKEMTKNGENGSKTK